MNYSLLFETLQQFNVRYVVCGGLAVNLHGIPRMTADVDIILDLTEDNLQRFEQCTKKINYRVNVPVKISELADEEKRRHLLESESLIAVTYFNYDKQFLVLDVVLSFPIPFSKLWDERVMRKDGDIIVNIVSIDHLIKLKELANRVQDRQDIYFLLKIKNGN